MRLNFSQACRVVSANPAAERILGLAERFSLDLSARYRELSHGNRQKVSLVQALIAAEMFGITQDNVDEMLQSDDPRIKRFLGGEPGNGAALR